MVPLKLRRLMSSQMTDRIVRVAVVASVLVSGILWSQLQNLTECVAKYNDANNQRSVILVKAGEEERAAERAADDAETALFLSPIVSKPKEERTPAEQGELQRLFRSYQMALSEQAKGRAAADDARRVHPIPDPPREVCG